MIHNLAITTPTVGSIRLGMITEKNGKRLPQRVDHFLVTAQHKNADGEWVLHPEHLRVCKDREVEQDKLTEIPIRLMFNDPELNMSATYEAFNRNGRTICRGDGKSARRIDGGCVSKVECPGALQCAYGQQVGCDLFARMHVQIEGQADQFSSFILRTESINSVRTLWAKMTRMRARFGGRLIGVPLLLKLRQKASKLSCWSKFFYADLVLDNISVEAACAKAEEYEQLQEAAGLDQAAYERTVKEGLAQSPFEDDDDNLDEMELTLLGRDIEPATDAQDAAATKVTVTAPATALDDAGDPPPDLLASLPAGLADLRDMIAFAAGAEQPPQE